MTSIRHMINENPLASALRSVRAARSTTVAQNRDCKERTYAIAGVSFSRNACRARNSRTRIPVELIPAVTESSSAV